ncbi:hypothetical protein LTR28_010488, partial [Elasticomyces elasticus]
QSVEKDRVPAAFDAFADGVGINKKAFRAGESTFINYPRGRVGLKKWTQKTSWAFRIGQSDYRKLGIGEGTDWTADFPTWFPEDEHPGHGIVGSGDGFEDFMQKLEAVESAIME